MRGACWGYANVCNTVEELMSARSAQPANLWYILWTREYYIVRIIMCSNNSICIIYMIHSRLLRKWKCCKSDILHKMLVIILYFITRRWRAASGLSLTERQKGNASCLPTDRRLESVLWFARIDWLCLVCLESSFYWCNFRYKTDIIALIHK